MKPVFEVYQPKKILNVHKHVDGGWFWIKYTADPYIGCVYGCSYCYSRDEKYNYLARYDKAKDLSDPFSQYIKVKENAPELLRKELRNKPVDLVYLSGYQPFEPKYNHVRGLLEVCRDLGFPVFINEKSPLLLNDLDLLKEINENTAVNVGFSIICTADDQKKHQFEPNTPSVEKRFDAMKELSKNNVPTGTIFMPMLPYIFDTEDNIKQVVQATQQAGGSYVLDAGLTLYGKCRPFFYKYLSKYDHSLIKKYDLLFSHTPTYRKHSKDVHAVVQKTCDQYNILNYIPRETRFYPEDTRVNKIIAAHFFITARELQMTGMSSYQEWTYRKAAWSIDELASNIQDLYTDQGVAGLKTISGVGDKLAVEIESYLQQL